METLPALGVLLMVVLAALPWGGDEATRFAISLLPMLAMQYWSARRPRLLPITLVFAAGIFLDVMSNGPLGFWALLGLMAVALGRLERLVTERTTALVRFASFVVAVVVLTAATWVVASVYFNQLIGWQTLAQGAIYAILAYPLLALVLLSIDRLLTAPRTRLLASGG